MMLFQASNYWDQEGVEAELRRLHEDGHTTQKIGYELSKKFGGVCTRNMVCGKINRLGLSVPREKKIAMHEADRVSKLAAPIPTVPEIALTADDIPIKQRKQILTLKPGDCRWPYGDVGTPGFFFCGGVAERKQSYCAMHCQIAYTKPYRMSDLERLAMSMNTRKWADPMGILLRGDRRTILDTDAA